MAALFASLPVPFFFILSVPLKKKIIGYIYGYILSSKKVCPGCLANEFFLPFFFLSLHVHGVMFCFFHSMVVRILTERKKTSY